MSDPEQAAKIKALEAQIAQKDAEIMSLWQQLEAANVEESMQIKEENGKLKQEVEALNTRIKDLEMAFAAMTPSKVIAPKQQAKPAPPVQAAVPVVAVEEKPAPVLPDLVDFAQFSSPPPIPPAAKGPKLPAAASTPAIQSTVSLKPAVSKPDAPRPIAGTPVVSVVHPKPPVAPATPAILKAPATPIKVPVPPAAPVVPAKPPVAVPKPPAAPAPPAPPKVPATPIKAPAPPAAPGVPGKAPTAAPKPPAAPAPPAPPKAPAAPLSTSLPDFGELPSLDTGGLPSPGGLEVPEDLPDLDAMTHQATPMTTIPDLPDLDAAAASTAPVIPVMPELPDLAETPTPVKPAAPEKPTPPAKPTKAALLTKQSPQAVPDVSDTAATPEPAPAKETDPEPEVSPAPVPGPVPAAKPEAAPHAPNVRVSVYFEQGPAGDPGTWVNEGFNILLSIAKANHSGEEIGANLDKFKDDLKSVVSYCQSMFPMTRKAHELKKKKEPLADDKVKELTSEIVGWKAEVIGKIK